MRTLRGELAEVKRCSEAVEEKRAVELKSLASKKVELLAKLKEMEVELAKIQAESFSSFEEGYVVCLAWFSTSGAEVEKHTFAVYVEELQAKMTHDGSGSSNIPANGGV